MAAQRLGGVDRRIGCALGAGDGGFGGAADLRGAVGELRGDMAGITWDENERIPVNRSDFAQLVEDGKIAETRRMAGQ